MGQPCNIQIGDIYSELTVIKCSGVNKRRERLWQCQCTCGKQTVVKSANLITKRTRSCGHLKRYPTGRLPHNSKDLTNQVFGRWTVIKFSHTSPPPSYMTFYICRCVCGKEKIVRRGSLTNGTSKSCGCLHQEQAAKNILAVRRRTILPYGECNFNKLYSSYKRGAQKAQREFSLTQKTFKDLVVARCFYCGKEPATVMQQPGSNGPFIYNGIDRKNNDLGYTLDNCVTCCKRCNFLKADTPQTEFINWILGASKWLTRQL